MEADQIKKLLQILKESIRIDHIIIKVPKETECFFWYREIELDNGKVLNFGKAIKKHKYLGW